MRTNSRLAVVLTNILVILPFMMSAAANGEWEDQSAADGRIVKSHVSYRIFKDGSYTSTSDSTVECVHDGFRRALGSIVVQFNAATTKIVDFKAWTINHGKQVAVDKKNVETKPVAGNSIGFDSKMRLTAAMSDVHVGSQVRRYAVMHTHTAAVPGAFFSSDTFGDEILENAGSVVEFVSDLPLFMSIAGADGYLEARQWRDGPLYKIHIELKKDAYFSLKNERSATFVKSPIPSIAVSSLATWTPISQHLGKGFASVINAGLPERFANQVDVITKNHKTFVDRSDQWTSWLVDQVRYMGDWRTVKGAYTPRPIAEVVRTGFGDCKDLAALTVAAFRKMGYEADAAAVQRGEGGSPRPVLSSEGAFNHAIVRVKDEVGHIHWIDPTNRVAYSRGVRSDIAGAYALVLNDRDGRDLVQLPDMQAADATIEARTEITLLSTHRRRVAMQMINRGVTAEGLAGLELNVSRERLNEYFVNMLADGAEVFSSAVEPFDLKSRIVRDVSMSGYAEVKWLPMLTTAGYIEEVSEEFSPLQTMQMKKRVSDYKVGSISRSMNRTVIHNAKLIGELPEACSVETPWLAASRNIRKDGDDLISEKTIEIRRSVMTLAELQSDAGRKLRRDLSHCFGRMSLIYEPREALTADVMVEDGELAH